MSSIEIRKSLINLLDASRVKLLGRNDGLDPSMPDLTESRYDEFEIVMQSVSQYHECMSALRVQYGGHISMNLLRNLTVDFILDALSGRRPANEISDKSISDLIGEIEKPDWEIGALSPLQGIQLDDQDEDWSFRAMPDTEIVISQDLALVGPDLGVSDFDNPSTWVDVTYETHKTGRNYEDEVCIRHAINRVTRLLLGMRLLSAGDVGSDVIGCKVKGHPCWSFVVAQPNLRVPKSSQQHEYQIGRHNYGTLAIFCSQLDHLLSLPHGDAIDIACEDFMAAYTKDPVDRAEGLVRCLQALFLRRRDKSWFLSKRVASFLSKDRHQFEFIDDLVKNGYKKIRSEVSHGNIRPSSLESEAAKTTSYLEEYCRRAIYFAIGLDKAGESAFLHTLPTHCMPSVAKSVKEAKMRADRSFWEEPVACGKAEDGEIVRPLLWREDIT